MSQISHSSITTDWNGKNFGTHLNGQNLVTESKRLPYWMFRSKIAHTRTSGPGPTALTGKKSIILKTCIICVKVVNLLSKSKIWLNLDKKWASKRIFSEEGWFSKWSFLRSNLGPKTGPSSGPGDPISKWMPPLDPQENFGPCCQIWC